MKPITYITTQLKNITDWYEQRNKEQALNVLNSKKQTYVASLFNGINTFLNLFTKYGAVIAAILSVTGFFGVTITPVGWIAVAGVMLAGGIALAGYSIYDHLKQTNKLKKDIEIFQEQDSKITFLNEEIKKQVSLNTILQSTLAERINTCQDLKIFLEAEAQVVPPQAEKKIEASAPPPPPKEKNAFMSVLKKCAHSISMFFIKLAHLLKLPALKKWIETKFPKAIGSVKKLLDLILPIKEKIKEFSGILTFVAASFSGFFVGFSSILGISIADQGFLQALATLAGSIHPMIIAIVCAAALFTSASLLLNKLLFQDPHAKLMKKLDQDKEGQLTTLNENQLLLESIENKNNVLAEKINFLTLKINLKSEELLKIGEFEQRRNFEIEEYSERFDLMSRFKKEEIQILTEKKADETKATSTLALLKSHGTFKMRSGTSTGSNPLGKATASEPLIQEESAMKFHLRALCVN